jgi:hypothetical protein
MSRYPAQTPQIIALVGKTVEFTHPDSATLQLLGRRVEVKKVENEVGTPFLLTGTDQARDGKWRSYHVELADLKIVT